MKNADDIKRQLRGLLCQELDRRLAESSKRLPGVCVNNYKHPLDHRKQVEGAPNPEYNRVARSSKTIGLCMLGSQSSGTWGGTICEDPVDAQRCPYFTPRQTQRQVYDEFLRDVETRELSGDVRALIWVLSDQTITLPWWKRVWAKYIHRVSYEPLQTPVRDIVEDLLSDRKPNLEQSLDNHS